MRESVCFPARDNIFFIINSVSAYGFPIWSSFRQLVMRALGEIPRDDFY